jgi:hypothetical protein
VALDSVSEADRKQSMDSITPAPAATDPAELRSSVP